MHTLQKKHFEGNAKNSASKNDTYTESKKNKKIFSADEAIALPVSTTDNILGKGNSSYKDVMEGFHRKRADYRPIQAKDAINYKYEIFHNFLDRGQKDHKLQSQLR